jgi:hypothetical protein
MESKRFTTLNPNYRNFLSNISKLINKIDINFKYLELEILHNQISLIAKENEIYDIDINKLILYCDNTNATLKNLKDLTYLKNIKLVEKTIKDNKYKAFINSLQNEYKKQTGLDITELVLEQKLLKLWEKYFNYWNGFWKFINCDKGKIKSIEFLDPLDIKELFKI